MIGVIIDKLKRHKDAVRYWRHKGVTIGEGCSIFPSAELGGEPHLVQIGDHVRITSNVVFITHDGGVWVLRHLNKELADIDRLGSITIGNNVHIGNNAVIMPNVTIGNNVIIGVGAIVTKNIPDNSIAVGIPARVIESIDEYCVKHAKDFLHTFNMRGSEKAKMFIRHQNNEAGSGDMK